ncbi:hypothetical protein C8J57DRAFT_1731654 [Mycena rebaudengoi]|nr:hypothetical protein C8J57DRAFT_1731654 [Mycena rebaudengoi]
MQSRTDENASPSPSGPGLTSKTRPKPSHLGSPFVARPPAPASNFVNPFAARPTPSKVPLASTSKSSPISTSHPPNSALTTSPLAQQPLSVPPRALESGFVFPSGSSDTPPPNTAITSIGDSLFPPSQPSPSSSATLSSPLAAPEMLSSSSPVIDPSLHDLAVAETADKHKIDIFSAKPKSVAGRAMTPQRREPLTPVSSRSTTSTPPRPPAPQTLPKAFTDKLLQNEERISSLELALARQSEELQASLKEQERLLSDLDDLENEQTLIYSKLDEQQRQIGDMKAYLQKLNLSASKVNDDGEDMKPKKTGKGSRDNVFNTAVRKTLFLAMGLGKTAKLQDAADVSSKTKGGGYIKDRETHSTVLRPDWLASFSDNRSWHDKLIAFTRQKAPFVNPILTKATMEAKTDDEILDRIEVVFKNIAALNRKVERLANEGAASDGEEEASKLQKQKGRQYQRKLRKCDERIAALAAQGIKLEDNNLFILTPQYQSTDESDDTDVLDPETDTEDKQEIPASSTRKPWISRPPTYRSETLVNGFDFIDGHVMERRRLYEQNNKGKTTAHPRKRGPLKDVPLPYIGAEGKKITRGFVDPQWLADHTDQDTPSRIQPADGGEDGEQEQGGYEQEREAEAMVVD